MVKLHLSMIDDIHYFTIEKVRTLLDKKEISSLDLTTHILERLKKLNPTLNSFITITEDTALEQAREADKRIAKGETSKLLGIPYSMKDVFSTKGIKTTAGSKILESYIPAYDSTVYKILKEEGAVLIGKTNCDAWGHGSSTENSDFGVTKNPWDTEYVPGGSSGGSAAAVAAGLGYFSIAEDTGGSIRMPASFCNCTGMKVTYGSVSRYGSIAYASSLDSVGPICRNIEDCNTVLRVISKQDPSDFTSFDQDFDRSSEKLSLVVPEEFFSESLNTEVKDAIQSAIEVFKNEEIENRDVNIPTAKYSISAYYLIAFSETSSNLGRYDSTRYGNDRSTFGSEAKRRILLGKYALAPEMYEKTYGKARSLRAMLSSELESALGDSTAIIAPVYPTPPFKINSKAESPAEMYLGDLYTVIVNPAGLPSLALPCGFSKDGLPIGMQLIGKHGSEADLLELGRIYQSKTDWHLKHPKI